MVGAEASFIRIAGAGLRLSLLLNAAACQLAQSRLEIHSIAKGISLFALTLKDVAKTLDATKMDLSPEVTDKTWEIASQGQMMFGEIEHMLNKLQRTDADDNLRRLPMQERLKWCFRKQHVTYLLASLESLKLSLMVMMRILQLADLIKSCSSLPSSDAPTADDAVAQEKAETQNMIIVRYWSTKRLERMWDSVEQEALDAANDQTSQRINLNYSNTTAGVNPLVAAVTGSGPDVTRLPAVIFGDIDVGLSDIERSPKDMVHLSEKAMNRLLSLWIPSLSSPELRNAGATPRDIETSRLKVYISSDSDEDSESLNSEGSGVRGYYLEGNTTDWRKPQSQQARYEAARLRDQYSDYQAHVESEPEDEGCIHPQNSTAKSRTAPPSEEGEQDRHQPSSSSFVNGGRGHSLSFTSGYAPRAPQNPDPKHVSFSPPNPTIPRSRASSYLQPTSNIPGPPQQRYTSNQDLYRSTPRSIPVPNRSNQPTSMPAHSPRGTPPSPSEPWPRSQGYVSKPRHHPPYPISSSSPESSFHLPPTAQRSPTHSRRSSREDREETKDRKKDLKRSATRGLVGIGAIAGFMDALEAFQIL
ncbi:hypothetical protein N7520_011664 [Penicillium odoratum]|uniref:uncharacterized protein n=1 Tax=Penicillium odoratum TaxID=1167516 RepID=UPI0025466ECC|nr:uncharacterized protein N7520_011664 [Penicillium odoratum]KAJ5746482.1 hypothetical protein N7520_011664 [Penicillium odoratum]